MIIMQMYSLSDTMKILSDETRVKLLHLLSNMELSVSEMTEAMGMNQSAVSNQLALLKKSGFTETRREGTRIYYRLPDDISSGDAGSLVRQVFDLGGKEGLFNFEGEALELILEARRRSSLLRPIRRTDAIRGNPGNQQRPGFWN